MPQSPIWKLRWEIGASAMGAEKRERAAARRIMEFKKLKVDAVTVMAHLIASAAEGRDASVAAALRTIDVVPDGRYGKGRPDLRVTVAIAAGIEAAIEGPWHGAHATLPVLIDDADAFATVAERILQDRTNTMDMLKEVRATLSREIAKARRRGLPYRTLDVTLTPSATMSYDLPSVLIGIEVLGPLLDAERVVFEAEGAGDVRGMFGDMREKQEQRLAMREKLAGLGGDVMIDAVTLAALHDANVSPAAAIAELRSSRNCIIDVDVRNGRMPLYVRDSIVIGNLPLGEGMHWNGGRLTIPVDRGIKAKNAKGKPLKRLIPHPLLDDDVLVEYATECGNAVWLHVRPRSVALSLASERKAA